MEDRRCDPNLTNASTRKVRIADARHADGTEHLAADDFDVLIVDGNRLETVDLLDLVDQVALELLDAEDRKDVVRIDRTVDERIALLR
jgi:hypothetical protein